MQKKSKLVLAVILIMFLSVVIILSLQTFDEKLNKTTVTIAVLWDDNVKDYNTNYYTEWLEEQTGYNINFEYMTEGYEKEYLKAMLTFNNNDVDAVFLPQEEEILSMDEFNEFCDKGLIFELSDYITDESNMKEIIEQYEFNESLLNSELVYYIPQLDNARKAQNMQILWLNVDWLSNLSIQIPRTTDDLAKVLLAFKENDPNNNGLQDEIPLISCEASYSMQSYNYLLNAFVYNDPLNNRMYTDSEGKLCKAYIEDEFRQGLIYCNALYEDGLLSDVGFSFSKKQLMEFVNNQEDFVGAFTSKSIADVIYSNCADILAKFIQVPPLEGPLGQQNAVMVNSKPSIGGYIPFNSKHPTQAYRIMDLMLSEEASLISEFGVEGTDWKYSENADLSTYGNLSKITTINYLSDSIQNKNFAGAGPLILESEYANGVAWNGNYSLIEYIDARAVNIYEKYYRLENIVPREILGDNTGYKALSTYTDNSIVHFITGDYDISDDGTWEKYVSNCDELLKKINETLVEE